MAALQLDEQKSGRIIMARDRYSRRDVLASLAMAGVSAGASSLGLGGNLHPLLTAAERRAAADRLKVYFHEKAPLMLRPAKGVLKQPSISPSLPGKAYSTSLWDWDTYWTSRGLFRLANLTGDRELHAKVEVHARGSLLNFLDHQSEEGRLPILIEVKNADPFDCLTKRTPNPRNQAKPVMGQLALLIADESKEIEWLAPRFDSLLRFYDSWTRGNQTPTGLLVWGNDVAIGDDNDPTTFGRPEFSSANLLLNCLFYQDLRASAELAQRLNRPQDHERLTAQAGELSRQIQKHCWDPRDHFYYTVDVQCVDRRAELIPKIKRGMAMTWSSLPLRVQMFTGFLPMWCGIASPQQAKEMVEENYLKDDRLRAPYGVRSLSSRETMYSLDFSSNPSNWLGPVWIIVNYLVWKGLKDYGFANAANELADKTLHLLASDLAANESLNEYYHPESGAALSHKGFMDWNLLVLEMLPGL